MPSPRSPLLTVTPRSPSGPSGPSGLSGLCPDEDIGIDVDERLGPRLPLDSPDLASGTGIWTNIQPTVRTAVWMLLTDLRGLQQRLESIREAAGHCLDKDKADVRCKEAEDSVVHLGSVVEAVKAGEAAERLVREEEGDYKEWCTTTVQMRKNADSVTRKNNGMIDSINTLVQAVKSCAGQRYIDRLRDCVSLEDARYLERFIDRETLVSKLQEKTDVPWFEDRLISLPDRRDVEEMLNMYGDRGQYERVLKELVVKSSLEEKMDKTTDSMLKGYKRVIDSITNSLTEQEDKQDRPTFATSQTVNDILKKYTNKETQDRLEKKLHTISEAHLATASDIEAQLKSIKQQSQTRSKKHKEKLMKYVESVYGELYGNTKRDIDTLEQTINSLKSSVESNERYSKEIINTKRDVMSTSYTKLEELKTVLNKNADELQERLKEGSKTLLERVESGVECSLRDKIEHIQSELNEIKTIIRECVTRNEVVSDNNKKDITVINKLCTKLDKLEHQILSIRQKMLKLQDKDELISLCDRKPSIDDLNTSLDKISSALQRKVTRETLEDIKRVQSGVLSSLTINIGTGRWAASKDMNVMREYEESRVLLWDTECVCSGGSFCMSKDRRSVVVGKTGLYKVVVGVYYSEQTRECPFFQVLVDDVPVISATTTEYYCEPPSRSSSAKRRRESSGLGDSNPVMVRYKGSNVIYHRYDFKTLVDFVSLAKGQCLKVLAINNLMITEHIEAFLQLQSI